MISGSKLGYASCKLNIVGLQLPALLYFTCYVRLHTLLPVVRVVGSCCAKFETSQTSEPTTPNNNNNDNKTFIIKRVLDKPRILSYNTTAGTLHPTRSGEECSEGEGDRKPEQMGTTQQVYFRFRRADTPRVQAVSLGLNNTFQPASVCYRCTFA